MRLFIFIAISFLFFNVHALPVKEVASLYPGSRFYVPDDNNSHPGIIVLHGSEGGSLANYRMHAQLLAADGFSVLAFCWYNCRKSPITDPYDMLMDVKLENLIKSISWFKQSRFVQGKKLGLYGFSRGAEKTLLMASMDTENVDFHLDAVAAHAPSDVVVGGFSWAWRDSRCSLCKDDTTNCLSSNNPSLRKWNPMCGPAWFDFENPSKIPAWTLNDIPLEIGKTVELEKYDGPILITHGEEDKVWSVDRTKRIEARLKTFGKKADIHYFPNEGHGFKAKAEYRQCMKAGIA